MTASDFDAIPVIGLGGPVDRVVADIVRACETAGFFYCVDHGVALAKIDAILDAARWLFGRPRAELASLDVATSPNFRGYVPMATAGPGVPLRLLEAFQMMLDLGPDDPDVRAGNIMYGPNRWPPGAGAFRAAMEDYYAEMTALSRRLLDLFARGLGLAPDHFESFFRKPLTQLRLLHYPPQPPDDPEARGVETHTDTGAFTILLQDETGGLEVRNRAGRWIPATPVPGGFVINIADMMQRWTGGRFVSTPHRVANRTGRDRYSVPFFRESRLRRDHYPARARLARRPVRLRSLCRSGLSRRVAARDVRLAPPARARAARVPRPAPFRRGAANGTNSAGGVRAYKRRMRRSGSFVLDAARRPALDSR